MWRRVLVLDRAIKRPATPSFCSCPLGPIITTTRALASGAIGDDTRDWLAAKGVTGARADGVVAELRKSGLSPSQMPSVLVSMGTAGLDQLLGAIADADADASASRAQPTVVFRVVVPRERHGFEVSGRVEQTLQDLTEAGDGSGGAAELGRYLECACGGIMACSTCHVILEPSLFAALAAAEAVSEAEQDMLDLAYGVTDTCVSG